MKYIVLIIVLSGFLFANQAEDKFVEANNLYNAGEYEQATVLYNELLNNGYNDEKVYYNLGNAYYKMNMIPHSILNYERALKVNPDYEDAKFNNRLANLKVIDNIEELPKVFYVEWYDNLLQQFSSSTFALFSTIFIWLALFFFLLFIVVHNPILKKAVFAFGVLSIIAFLSSGILAYNDYHIEQNRKEAIIFQKSVYVKSSPDDAGTNLFMLHEGTKVEVLDEVNRWKRIRLVNGNIGWISPGSIEII